MNCEPVQRSFKRTLDMQALWTPKVSLHLLQKDYIEVHKERKLPDCETQRHRQSVTRLWCSSGHGLCTLSIGIAGPRGLTTDLTWQHEVGWTVRSAFRPTSRMVFAAKPLRVRPLKRKWHERKSFWEEGPKVLHLVNTSFRNIVRSTWVSHVEPKFHLVTLWVHKIS